MLRNKKIVLALALASIFTGCTIQQPEKKEPIKKTETPKTEIQKAKILNKQLNQRILSYKPTIKPKKIIKYKLSSKKKFTLNASDISIAEVLYLIAKDANINLIINQNVNKKQKITLHLSKIDMQDALDIVTKNAGLFYEIDKNVLYINSISSEKFDISFINATSNFGAILGGDVLGGSKSEGMSGSLKSEFSISYGNQNKQIDGFVNLRNSLQPLLSEDGKYSINESSATLIVQDKYTNIQKVKELLNDMKDKLSKQVLIEAKVLEVVLTDQYNMGIDWQRVVNFTINNSPTTVNLTSGAIIYNSTNGGSFEGTLQALKEYGNIDTLSNPRIRVLNGQSAIISSGKIEPFWEKKITQISSRDTTGTIISTPEITYTRRDVLDGISMGVIPFIKEDDKIILNIVPVSTTIEATKTHPDGSTAPILNVKEAGTIIEVKDNDIVIIGGLLSEKVVNADASVPLLSDIPLAGGLFERTEQIKQKRELVIFLKINLLNQSATNPTQQRFEYIDLDNKKDEYTVQAGIFSNYPKDNFLKTLDDANLEYEVLEIQSSKNPQRTLYIVNVGSFINSEYAQTTLNKVHSLNIKDAFINKVK